MSNDSISSVKKETISFSEVSENTRDNETEKVGNLEAPQIDWQNPSDLKKAVEKVVLEEMKRKDSVYQNFRKGKIEKIYSSGDFIQNALEGALPFKTEDWEAKSGLFLSFRLQICLCQLFSLRIR